MHNTPRFIEDSGYIKVSEIQSFRSLCGSLRSSIGSIWTNPTQYFNIIVIVKFEFSCFYFSLKFINPLVGAHGLTGHLVVILALVEFKQSSFSFHFHLENSGVILGTDFVCGVPKNVRDSGKKGEHVTHFPAKVKQIFRFFNYQKNLVMKRNE